MSGPVVSVVLPFHNRAATLPRAIESVRAQTFADWEMLAVDDASTDESAAIVAGLGDSRVRVLRHPENRGASAARNTGIREARGEFIALLDSDDEWLPEKLARQIADLHGAAGFSVCDHLVRTATAEHLVRIVPSDDWRRRLHFECGLASGSTLVIRRTCLETSGLFDERFRSHEDWDLDLRLAKNFPLAVTTGPLARIHAATARNPRAFAEGAQMFLDKHADDFAAYGAAHRRRVEAHHYAAVAALAFAARDIAFGFGFLAKALRTDPFLPPLRHAAALLALVDGCFGTELVAHATAWRSRRRGRT
jgi:glycosyltransferase involved in cell wall biosynthesis